MKRSRVMAAVLAMAGIGLPLGAGSGAEWLTDEARAIGLMLLPAAFAASLLVLYFEWRRRLRDQLRADHG